MISTLVVLLVFSFVFFFPGGVVICRLGITKNCFVWALAISYLYALVVVFIVSTVLLPLKNLVLVWYSLPVALAAFHCFSDKARLANWLSTLWTRVECGTKNNFLAGALGIGFFFWLLWIGPFNEIPTDFWAHLESINLERKHFENGLYRNDNPWYFILGAVWYLTNSDALDFVWALYLFSSSVFVFSIFSLLSQTLSNKIGEKSVVQVLAIIGTGLFLLSFGLGPFAYFRYYFAAPGFFAYIFYLLIIFGLLNVSRGHALFRACVTSLLILLLYQIHRQEALFASIYVFLWAWIIGTKWVVEGIWEIRRGRSRDSSQVRQITTGPKMFLSSVGALAILFLISGAISQFDGNATECITRGFCKMVSFGPPEWGIKLLFGNYHYQFGGAVGWAGILAIGLTLINLKKSFGLSAILLAGLALTFFNPIYVDYFLNASSAEVLWRHAYLFPAGLLLATEYGRFLEQKQFVGLLISSKRVSAIVVCLPLLFLLGLGLLVEGQASGKRLTFDKVSSKNNHEIWEDLIIFMDQFPSSTHVLTDPITGYVLAGLTKVSHARWKFHKKDYIEFNLPGYSPGNYDSYIGWLLVINRRDGGRSKLGDVSGHWPETVMSVSDHYSSQFIDHVETTPSRFLKIWEENEISIYSIVGK